MSNATLMAAISTGTRAESDAAFSELVDAWQGKITGYAHKMLRDWDASEDIFQSVMLTVFQHSGNFREIGTTKQGVSGEMSTIVCAEIGVFQQNGRQAASSFSGWIYAICHRRCLDAIRRRKHDALSLRASPTADCDPLSVVAGASRLPLDAIVEREEIAEFTAELDKIPDDQRAVLELFNEGFTFVEIAEASGQKLPTVKSKARLAREKLERGVIRNRVGALVEKMFA
jgi:RNA polymerase sigma factor (sigma-70 family)